MKTVFIEVLSPGELFQEGVSPLSIIELRVSWKLIKPSTRKEKERGKKERGERMKRSREG
jgi:hypothetical protein